METIEEIKESQPVSTHQLLRKVYNEWYNSPPSNVPFAVHFQSKRFQQVPEGFSL